MPQLLCFIHVNKLTPCPAVLLQVSPHYQLILNVTAMFVLGGSSNTDNPHGGHSGTDRILWIPLLDCLRPLHGGANYFEEDLA